MSKYRLELRENENNYWAGQVFKNGVPIADLKTENLRSKANTLRALNKRIESFNFRKELTGIKRVPLFRVGDSNCEIIPYSKQPKQEPTMNTAETLEVNIKTQRKKVIPRKPFTPYGLNGYLVDKAGNVRLHLDRKASSKTITITPDMFDMLADMVKVTLTQGANQ
ncbi:hypothetical protein GVX76_10990 [[Haemophilus] felis]|nr:hypothetical protein [[Haemophilus] felis]